MESLPWVLHKAIDISDKFIYFSVQKRTLVYVVPGNGSNLSNGIGIQTSGQNENIYTYTLKNMFGRKL